MFMASGRFRRGFGAGRSIVDDRQDARSGTEGLDGSGGGGVDVHAWLRGKVLLVSRCPAHRTCRSAGRPRSPRARTPRVRRRHRPPARVTSSTRRSGPPPSSGRAIQRVEEIAGALGPNPGVEQGSLGRQILQRVGKVCQLVQEHVGRERADGADVGPAGRTRRTRSAGHPWTSACLPCRLTSSWRRRCGRRRRAAAPGDCR